VLRTRLIHPEILAALAAAGHGSQLLLSDGNFPHATASPPGARRVYLNLSPGRVTVTEVL
jgi:L-fucose mutarotase